MKKLSLISILESVQEKTSADLHEFLKLAVPYIVKTKIVEARALKSCGVVSSLFTRFARKEGFSVFTESGGNHFFNIVETTDGTWKVDLSYIQFMLPCGVSEMDDDYREHRDKLLKQATEDPFSVIKVEKIGEGSISPQKYSRKDDATHFTKAHAEYYYDQMYGRKHNNPNWWNDYSEDD